MARKGGRVQDRGHRPGRRRIGSVVGASTPPGVLDRHGDDLAGVHRSLDARRSRARRCRGRGLRCYRMLPPGGRSTSRTSCPPEQGRGRRARAPPGRRHRRRGGRRPPASATERASGSARTAAAACSRSSAARVSSSSLERSDAHRADCERDDGRDRGDRAEHRRDPPASWLERDRRSAEARRGRPRGCARAAPGSARGPDAATASASVVSQNDASSCWQCSHAGQVRLVGAAAPRGRARRARIRRSAREFRFP